MEQIIRKLLYLNKSLTNNIETVIEYVLQGNAIDVENFSNSLFSCIEDNLKELKDDSEVQNRIDNAIAALDLLKKHNPETIIYVETPNGTCECKLGDANIYDTPDRNIAIDAE